MTAKQPDFNELNTLAIEACDMWQEHLSTLANDPSARAELTRFLEPQRRLFADWVAMMQRGGVSTGQQAGDQQTEGSHDSSDRAPTDAPVSSPIPQPESQPASRSDEHGDDALRVAQLAYRVAELEKRLAQLESSANPATGTPRRTQRASS